jgi:hypothetical protein
VAPEPADDRPEQPPQLMEVLFACHVIKVVGR